MVKAGLAEAAIVIGTKRLWPIAFLGAWMAKQQGQKAKADAVHTEDYLKQLLVLRIAVA